ncbi:MAG: hypothetical protein LBT00_14495 [Spirochaetaceae bacterium]|jgi:hypothetical protein|nr:hypothetical protein [Spirochaetaceae bacterium]
MKSRHCEPLVERSEAIQCGGLPRLDCFGLRPRNDGPATNHAKTTFSIFHSRSALDCFGLRPRNDDYAPRLAMTGSSDASFREVHGYIVSVHKVSA